MGLSLTEPQQDPQLIHFRKPSCLSVATGGRDALGYVLHWSGALYYSIPQ